MDQVRKALVHLFGVSVIDKLFVYGGSRHDASQKIPPRLARVRVAFRANSPPSHVMSQGYLSWREIRANGKQVMSGRCMPNIDPAPPQPIPS
jgi:hypothetical protein